MNYLPEIKSALNKTSFNDIFSDCFGLCPEDVKEGADWSRPVMFNTDSGEIFFYDSEREPDWVRIYVRDNAAICIGHISAEEILTGDPTQAILEFIEEKYKGYEPQ